jgi:hypothetical protein
MSKGKLNRFGPRIGVVYDPRGQGREVVRAAYGIVHDQPPMFHHVRVASVPPWGSLITLNDVPLSNPYANYPGGNPFPIALTSDAVFPFNGTYWTQQLEANTPYTQHWNVSTQKQFGNDWSVTLSYFGNRTNNVWGGIEINPAVFGPGATTGNTNQRRRLVLQNPTEGRYFASVVQLDMEGQASYHGGLFAVQKRFADNYSVSVNHTWSHCIDNANSQQFLDPVYTQPDNPEADRGDCVGDRRHVFNASAVMNTPTFESAAMQALAGGWQLSVIYQAQTGPPLNVTTGQDNALTGVGGQRPNLVGDWKLDDPTPQAWFNTAAFAFPAAGTYGNVGRNSIRGPGAWNVDMALSRRFNLFAEHRIEIRAEAFNVFNRVRPGTSQGVNGFSGVGQPNTALNNTLFGRITSAADPRILQFAMKYVF